MCNSRFEKVVNLMLVKIICFRFSEEIFELVINTKFSNFGYFNTQTYIHTCIHKYIHTYVHIYIYVYDQERERENRYVYMYIYIGCVKRLRIKVQKR